MSGKLTKAQRFDWIERAIEEELGNAVDVLNRDFVDAYTEATGVPFRVTFWGANKCAQLGRDLTEMKRKLRLKRARIGLSGGAWMPGFPKWVWSYRLGPASRVEREKLYADLKAEEAGRAALSHSQGEKL